MAYGIIRVKNLHAGDIKQTGIHNNREFEKHGQEFPTNINRKATDRKQYGSETHHHEIWGDAETLEESLNKRLENTDVKPRKNSVVALEYVATLSPEAIDKMKNGYCIKGLLSEITGFIVDRHGADNVLSTSQHFDESNPHVHVVVTPIAKKSIAYKNRYGSGLKEKNTLVARDFTGGPSKLSKLQDDYHTYLQGRFGAYFKDFGIDFKRGVKAKDRRARGEFYDKMTNHLIAKPMQEIREAKEAVQLGEITPEQGKEIINISERKIKAISDGIDKKKQKDSQRYKEGKEWGKTTRSIDIQKKTKPKSKDQGMDIS